LFDVGLNGFFRSDDAWDDRAWACCVGDEGGCGGGLNVEREEGRSVVGGAKDDRGRRLT
jgi:hypothetical protein